MIKVFGDGLDALVAINSLLKSGHEVSHYTKSVRIAGHFSGIHTCGRNFDLGMVLLEPDFNGESSFKLENLGGEFGRDSRKFLREVFSWLEGEIGGFVRHPVLTQLDSGLEIPDYFIADNLDFLKTIDQGQINSLQTNIELLIQLQSIDKSLHPSNKMTSELATSTPLVDVLNMVFGPEIYQKYFGGFVEKISGSHALALGARDNRRLWLPNFYPETILNYLTGGTKFHDFGISPLVFFRPSDMQIAEFVNQMDSENQLSLNYKRIEFYGQITLEQLKDRNSLCFIGLSEFLKSESLGFNLPIESPVVSGEQQLLFSGGIQLTHFCVSESDSKTVFIPKPDNPVLRYSCYSGSLGNSVSIESVPDKNFLKSAVKDFLNEKGLSARCDGYSLLAPLKLGKNKFSSTEWQEFLDSCKENLPTIGQSLFVIHPEANNFNDSLMRGLAAFKKWRLHEN